VFQEADFSSLISLWPSSSSGDPFHTADVLLFIDLWCMERCLGTNLTRSHRPAEVPHDRPPVQRKRWSWVEKKPDVRHCRTLLLLHPEAFRARLMSQNAIWTGTSRPRRDTSFQAPWVNRSALTAR